MLAIRVRLRSFTFVETGCERFSERFPTSVTVFGGSGSSSCVSTTLYTSSTHDTVRIGRFNLGVLRLRRGLPP